MDVELGYKRTTFGVIPEDWLDRTIGDFFVFEGGSQPDKSVFHPTPRKGYVRLVQIRDYKTDKYTTYIPTHLARRFCCANDIMIGRYGPPVFQILRGIEGAYNVALIKAIPKGIDQEYAFYFLKQKRLFQFVEKLSQRSSGQTGVDLVRLKLYPLPLPPTRAEQEAIAEALSDTDALIESLEQLIAKKRLIKQGLMQELLTGKRRLPGFAGDWGETTFGTAFDFLPTATNPRSDLTDNGDCYYIHYGDIHTRFHSHLDFASQEPPRINRVRAGNAALIRNGDWIMADASEDYSGVGKTVEVRGLSPGSRAVAGLHTFLLRERETTFAPGFKGHLGGLKTLHEEYLRVATGMKVYGVSKTALRSLLLPVPPLPEQQAIADLLSALDSEIRSLSVHLEKSCQLKQGMMQQLLTGRIRLV